MATPVAAEQLVVKEFRYRIGHSSSIEVKDTAACINGAKNISNLQQTSDIRNVGFDTTQNFYSLSFYCVTENGDITASGKYYQIPMSKGKLCIYWSNWNGYNFSDDVCEVDNFRTEPFLLDNNWRSLKALIEGIK